MNINKLHAQEVNRKYLGAGKVGFHLTDKNRSQLMILVNEKLLAFAD